MLKFHVTRVIASAWIVAVAVPSSTAAGQTDATRPVARCPIGDTAKAGVSLAVQLSASVTRATDDADKYGAGLLYDNERHPEACGWRRQRTVVDARPNYDSKTARDAAPIVTRHHVGSLRHLAYLPGNRAYLSGEARYLHSTTLGLDLQQGYSVKLGRTWDPSRRLRVELAAGPAYVLENFTGPTPSTTFAAAELFESASLGLGSAGAELAQTLRFTQPLQAGQGWSTKAQVILRLPLRSRINILLGVFDDYTSSAPPGFDKNYFNTSLGVELLAGRAR